MDIIKNQAQRMEYCSQLGRLKQDRGMEVIDGAQELKQMDMYQHVAQGLGIDQVFVTELFQNIMNYSKNSVGQDLLIDIRLQLQELFNPMLSHQGFNFP